MNAKIQRLHPDYVQAPASLYVISTAGRNLELPKTSVEIATSLGLIQTASNNQLAQAVKQPEQFDNETNTNKRPTEMPRRRKMKTTINTTQALHTAALTGLLSLALLSPATAADFAGNLKGVTITDAQATNKAPSAAFTYTVSGETVTFNAGGSSDTDGTITEYKWDFGDGSSGSGAQVQHTYTTKTVTPVTLTIVDNNNGVALNQKAITLEQYINITDDFNRSNGSIGANWTPIIAGTLGAATPEVYNNAVRVPTYLAYGIAKYSGATFSANQYAELKMSSTAPDASGVGLRLDNSGNGYFVRVSGNYITVYKLTSGNGTKIGADFSASTGTTNKVLRGEINGSTITVKCDGVELGTRTDSSYIFGSPGILIRGNKVYDNFAAGDL